MLTLSRYSLFQSVRPTANRCMTNDRYPNRGMLDEWLDVGHVNEVLSVNDMGEVASLWVFSYLSK